jgi:hypothetical protein
MANRSLQDLIRDGTLPVGTELYHKRRQDTGAATARVTAGGIEVEGTVYASPSGAARGVIGNTAVNGWQWWRVKPHGRRLSDIRPRGDA